MTPVSAEEVAALLKRVAAGDIAVKAIGQSWDAVFAGDVTFELSTGDTVVIFNDCDSLDYVDYATLSDGRRADFDDWQPTNVAMWCDPLALLTDEEQLQLEQRLKAAPATEQPWWLKKEQP